MRKGLGMQKKARIERKKFKSSKPVLGRVFFTSENLELLLPLGGICAGLCLIYLLFSSFSFFQSLGIIINICLMGVLFFLGVYGFYPEFLTRRHFLLALVIVLSTALMSRIFVDVAKIPSLFVPFAFLSTLFALFFNFPISILILFVFCMIFSLVSQDIYSSAVWFCGGLTGAYGASLIHKRIDVTRVGLLVGAVNFIFALGTGFIEGARFPDFLYRGLWGFGSGIFSSILINVTLPYFETYFGITTDIGLMELADLNHPLLHRLSIEAPGTYHHTLTVATLAVAAAEAVGANSLLARVGAYYHDIGKVTRPHFFFENSGGKGKVDYHSRVSPNLSSMIIISHVKDGVELARIFRLPQVVIDIISQHHGTGLIAYFYRKALVEDKKEKFVDESNFRYPGPKPKTKEAAIVMLADSVEADFRFSPTKNPKMIKLRIKKVIENKLKDHQLDEVDFTLRELHLIEEAFSRVLTGLSHTRGRYPEEMLKNEEKDIRSQQYV
ncbi:HDIG domain-containing protein [Candidatus Aerophobetes bacterium]|nr:HDIG domain-containing protein [Candidatus Aerophobetes bacterium]